MIAVRLVTVAAIIALSGCATPQTQLQRGLMKAGLSKSQSSCMADRMVDKLSLLQLRRLSSLGNFEDEKLSDMSISRFMRNIRALKDPEILTVTTRAGLGCAIAG